MISIRSYLGQQGRSQWAHKRLSEKQKLRNRLMVYIHAHPLMIVGIDTIPSDDGGHRGTGGGGGEEQGWIVGEGEYLSKYETLCMVADRGVSGHRGAGRCMYVHGMACMCGIYLLSLLLLPRF